MSKAFLFAVVLALGAAAISWWAGHWQLPARHDPRAPLSLAEPPGWLTGWKLSRLSRNPQQCREVLSQAPWQTQPEPDRRTGDGCGFQDAVRVERMQWRIGQPFTLTCPAAVSLALWERHVVMPAAIQYFGRPVERLDHLGSYACRNLYGRDSGSRSRHATANAFDVAGFVLEGGRRVTVARDWGTNSPEALFLRHLHDGACRWFDVVLGPDYNAAHHDHLHLDRGPNRLCR